MTKYVEDSFQKYAHSSTKSDKVQKELKKIISIAEEQGAAWTIDWSKRPLPEYLSHESNSKLVLSHGE